MKHWILPLTLITLCVWLGCSKSTAPPAMPQTEDLSAEALKSALESNEKPLLVDVRSPEEFAAGHMPGAINIPVTELEAHTEQLPKDQPVVVY